MTADEVAERLREAVDVLRRLPGDDRRFFDTMRTVWPDMRQTRIENWWAYNSPTGEKSTVVRLRGAAPDEIDRMDEALAWLLWLKPGTKAMTPRGYRVTFPKDVRGIVFARAHGWPWPKIISVRRGVAKGGNSIPTVRLVNQAACRVIADRVGA